MCNNDYSVAAVSFTFLASLPSETRLTHTKVFLICKSIQTGRVISTRITGTGILKKEKELVKSHNSRSNLKSLLLNFVNFICIIRLVCERCFKRFGKT